MKFNRLDIQDSYKCSADYLSIHEFNTSGDMIGLFCGNGHPPVITSSVALWLLFHSDWILDKSGFSLQYEISGIYKAVEILNFQKGFFGMRILTCIPVLGQNASTCDVISGSAIVPLNADIP